MPWKVRHPDDRAIVETVYAGLLSPEELLAAARATVAEARARGTRLLLGDCSELEGGHSVVDLYGLLDLFGSIENAHEFREAVLMPSLAATAEDVRFWETACRNRGLEVRAFRQRAEALAWLLKRP
jgi:hypothetical protein